MAQITWKNINAPDFSGALHAGQRASDQMTKALDPLETLLTDAQARDEANFKNAGERITQGLEAQFRNAATIGQLDQMANPEALREQHGALANMDKLRQVEEEQRALIRDQNTDALLSGVQTPKSQADIQALLQGADSREINVDRASNTLTDRMQGIRADTTQERAEEEYLREKAGRDEADDIKGATNAFVEAIKMGVPTHLAKGAALEMLSENTDRVKAQASFNAASDQEYNLTIEMQQGMADYDARTEIERAQIVQKTNQQINAAQAKYDHITKVGVSPSTMAEASEVPGGTLQYVHSIVQAKGNHWMTSSGIKDFENALNRLRAIEDPQTGVQLYSEKELNAIGMQAWNNTATGKKDGWWTEPHVTQEVLNQMARLAQQLPKQRAAATVLQDTQQQAQNDLYIFEEDAQTYREQLRDNLRTGKPISPRPTDAQRIMVNAKPGDGLSTARQNKMDNNRPTINGQRLPEGASAREFTGAWTQKVNEVLGTSEAFAGTPAEAVEQAMVATPIIETNNGTNLGNNPNTVGIVQMQEARRKDLGLTEEEAADPVIALRAQEKWYEEVAVPTLEKANLPVNPTNLFVIHNQGATGGIEILLAAQAEDKQLADTTADHARAEELAQIQTASDADKHAEEALKKSATSQQKTGPDPLGLGRATRGLVSAVGDAAGVVGSAVDILKDPEVQRIAAQAPDAISPTNVVKYMFKQSGRFASWWSNTSEEQRKAFIKNMAK